MLGACSGSKKVDLSHLSTVFIFCVRVLLRRDRWHQVVALCRRFSFLGRGPAFHCALSLGFLAQQKLVAAKKAALQKVRERKTAAVKAQELAAKMLEKAESAAAQKELQEP